MRSNQELAALRRKVEIGSVGPYRRHDVGFPLAALDHLDDIAIGERLLPSWLAGRRPGRRLLPLLAGYHRARHGHTQNQRLKLPAHVFFPRVMSEISEIAREGQRK
jgi:hypothetical protein